MHMSSAYQRVILCLALALGIIAFTHVAATAQSQEPKPVDTSSTPAAAESTPVESVATSGLQDSEWQSPVWGVRLAWDPEIWTVENELIEGRYEGLQLGSEDSTVYVEAYEAFGDSAQDCLAAAEQEIAERTNTREVTRLARRPYPEAQSADVASMLFGVVADIPDGRVYRGTEYVACRSIDSGNGVLETTWQTATTSYNNELSRVSTLFASLLVPDGHDALLR